MNVPLVHVIIIYYSLRRFPQDCFNKRLTEVISSVKKMGLREGVWGGKKGFSVE